MNKIRIIEAGNELGLGGTENVIQLYSKFLDKNYFDVTVVGIRTGGARAEIIENLGIKVIVLKGDLNALKALLQEADVFHWHGDGSLNPELFEIVKANKPRLVIQTNIFGLHDRSPLYDCIDYDMYVSKMILIRRMILDQDLADNFAARRKALANPVDVSQITNTLSSESELLDFKMNNKMEDYFIVGRIGRASDAKFDLITLDGFAAFSSQVGNARFLLVGATPNMLEYARYLGITDKLIVFENTLDLKQLLMYYQALDIFLAASRIGESFGLVIAEAMAAGIPVVTVSLPRKDNAQIELVDNNQTGLVVERSADSIASALLYLYQNEKIRKDFAIASKRKVWKEYRADHIVGSLQNLILNHFDMPQANEYDSLIKEYADEILVEYANRCTDLWIPES